MNNNLVFILIFVYIHRLKRYQHYFLLVIIASHKNNLSSFTHSEFEFTYPPHRLSILLGNSDLLRGPVGETSLLTGEGKRIGIGSCLAAVSTIVCTAEGCNDLTSPAPRFLRGCVRLGGHEFVDSPDKSSFSNPK